MTVKHRLSVSVDQDLVDAGRGAVAAGRAPSLSAWVSAALHRQVEEDRRFDGLGQYLDAYEREHGPITDEEIEAVRAHDRATAVRVRGGRILRPSASDAA